MPAKYNLEYQLSGTKKIVDPDIVTIHKKATFGARTTQTGSSTNWLVTVNWDNGNFQRVNTNYNGQWIAFSNPGTVGRYELVVQKTHISVEGVAFGNGSTLYTNIDWPYGEVNWAEGAGNEKVLITFIWDGTTYTAIQSPWY